MLKKVLTGALVIVIIGTYGVVGYSVGNDSEIETKDTNNIEMVKKESTIDIIYPEDNLITTDKVVLLSGRARQGVKIIVEVYSSSNLTGVNFNVDTLPINDTSMEDVDVEEVYTLESKEVLEVGDLGVFAKELELKPGKNKISIYVVDDEVTDIVTKYVYVTDMEKVKEYIDDIGSMNFSETIRQMIDLSNNQDTSMPFFGR